MKPGMMNGKEGSDDMPSSISITWILPSRTSIEAGDKLLDRQSTRLPLMVKWFMNGNLRRIWIV
jgi:hypothetical protein